VWVACFQRSLSSDFTAEMNTGGQFGKIFYEDEFRAGRFELVPAERQTDISLFMLPFPEPCAENSGVGIDTTRSGFAKESQESPAVVIVPMTEDDPVQISRVKMKGHEVCQQGLTATGIKQPSPGRSLQQTGKAMLAACGYRPTDGIFTDDIKLQ
jgi:hypothetical protein